MLNKGNELVSFRLGVHAEYTTSRELLEGMAELAHEYKQPVYLHLAETKKEVADRVAPKFKTLVKSAIERMC